MFIISLYRFIRGYVEILVKGYFAERLLNLFSKNNISVFNINRTEDGITLMMLKKDFMKIRRIRGNNRIKIKLISKNGVPFLVKKYHFRIGIPVGVALFFLIIELLSMFIWNIEVTGNKNISTSEITEICSELGVRKGVYIRNIDTKILSQELLLKCDKLSWAAMNIEGSRLTVNVSEAIKKDTSDPSNIIAECDCVITEITVESGVSEVVKGQAVRAGEIIISGIEQKGEVLSFVRSRGEIKAMTEEILEESGDFSREISVPTGKKLRKTVFEFFGIKIPLYLGNEHGQFNCESGYMPLKLLGVDMPIGLYYKDFHFLKNKTQTYCREDVLQMLEDNIIKRVESVCIGDYIILNREISDIDSGVVLRCTVRYEKNVGREEKILFSPLN